jgi:hypothetical protein
MTPMERQQFPFMAALLARADGRIEITEQEIMRLSSFEVETWHDEVNRRWVFRALPPENVPQEQS